MIERWITNPLTLKRYRRFRSVRRSVVSVWIFGFMIFLSVTAEMWSNSKPIILYYNGSLYMPIYEFIHPSEVGQADAFVTNYRQLQLDESDFAIWPLNEWDPLESNKEVEEWPSPPSSDNLMGTDDRGRDVLARLIYGFRYSIGYALIVWALSYIIGIGIGAFMGFSGGWIDLIGQRLVEVFESVPALLMLITIISVFGSNFWVLVLFSIFFNWMMISVYIRAEFLKLRKRDFVESARAIGQSRFKIIFKHVLPNAISPIVTFSPFTIAGNIYALSMLDYLGFGLPPPTPSWGELLQQTQKHITVAWWIGLFPSLAIVISLLVLNLIGEGVRDAFDPRHVSE